MLRPPKIEERALRMKIFLAGATGASPVHVEAAAWAALLAFQRDARGIYNIAEDGPEVSGDKARRELGWHAALRWPAELLR